MKKQYSKPSLEVEVYQLNAALAAGCTTYVNMGPGTVDGVYPMCSDYEGSMGDGEIEWSMRPRGGTTPFYDDQNQYCSCYYTSGGQILVTS